MPFPESLGRLLRFGLLIALLPAYGVAQRIDEFALAAGSGPAGLAVGSDGNIWFAEEAGNRIGRLTPAGVLTEFPLINPGSRPHGLATAADGVLITEGAGRIGHITAMGVLSESATLGGAPKEIAPGPFAQYWWSDPLHDQLSSTNGEGGGFGGMTLAPGSHPEGVASGAGGDLWVAENGAGRIARLYRQPPPSGIPSVGSLQFQEFALPDAASGPWGICLGPDGNVWFTELAAGRIGRLNPTTGQVTEFSLPAGAEPRGIVTGQDLNLWFTDSARDLAVRMTPDGSMVEFPLPTRGSRPMQLVAPPDGNIWFSEAGTDRIGRLTIPPFCSSQPQVLCLNGGRFQASVSWFFSRTGSQGTGRAVPLAAATGAFWFFTADNLELVVKVIDGRPVNGKFWVFVGAMTDGQWVLEIRDTETGQIRRYQNSEGQLLSLADTEAF
jgi:streptogramin lyase